MGETLLDTRPVEVGQSAPPAVPTAPAPAPIILPPPRRGRSGAWLVVAGAVAAVLGSMLWGRLDLWPSLPNPFGQTTVDRSAPPLMLALNELSDYHAATGSMQVLVDLERDTAWVPSFISGEHTTFFAVGHVDATVDFSALGSDRVVLSGDGRAATISLPAPELGQVVLDTGASRVLSRDRGVLDRVGDAFGDDADAQRELFRAAQAKLADAAPRSDLVERAESNTRDMLTTLAHSLGITDVTVNFGS